MTAADASLPTLVRREGTGRALLMLLVFLAISAAVAAFGSLSSISNVDGWYETAEKVFWNPPNWVFGPVWTLLYTLMSIAAWLVWLRRTGPGARSALWTYVVQLVLNALWTPVFFAAYPLIGPAALWIALAIIVALDVAILLTMLRFWPLSRAAAWLLVPYWVWVLYATTLNAGLAVLNG
jgi:tryptophan-rich sensory protein